MTPYRKGLAEIGDGVFAYLQPDGGWGWSNAGLIVGEGESLLVDTLFDLRLTAEMLDAMAPHTATTPITTLVNTHANGDHCYGNELVVGAEIIASAASAAEMADVPPSLLAALVQSDLGPELDRYVADAFGPFEFDGIVPTPPTRTFAGSLALEVGGRPVELTEVGPAHTRGDVLVHLRDADVIFTGDILFIGGTPIVWDGPIANWLAACDRIIEADAAAVVPGHGPVTDASGARDVRDYLSFVHSEASARHSAGMSVLDAAADIELGAFADWGEPERIVVNVDAVYRELDPAHVRLDTLQLFSAMAALSS